MIMINKEAQLSLGNALQPISCCSADLQGHPKSMIFILSEKV